MTKTTKVIIILLLLAQTGAITMLNLKQQQIANDMQVLAEFVADECIIF